MEKILCSREETAEVLGCGLTKYNELRLEGAFETCRLGKRRMTVVASLQAFVQRLLLAEQSAESASPPDNCRDEEQD